MAEAKTPEASATAKTTRSSADDCTAPVPAEGTRGACMQVLLKVLHCLFSLGFISAAPESSTLP